MKAIRTTNRHGTATANDGDGNRIRIAANALSYDEGHRAAPAALCQRMGWTGTLHGGYMLRAGRTNGMVWTWTDARYTLNVSNTITTTK